MSGQKLGKFWRFALFSERFCYNLSIFVIQCMIMYVHVCRRAVRGKPTTGPGQTIVGGTGCLIFTCLLNRFLARKCEGGVSEIFLVLDWFNQGVFC